MNHRLILYFILLLGVPAVIHAAAPQPTEQSPYIMIYRSSVDQYMAKKQAEQKRNPRRVSSANDISEAYAAWILGERLGEPRYRDFALRLYDQVAGRKVEQDFHISRPFGLLTLRIQRAGLLTGGRRDLARRQAFERITWFLDKRRMDEKLFDCNIALADTLAVDCLARVFADDLELRPAEIQRRVAALGQRILATGDLNENASNYSSLGICFFIELAQLEGWLDEVARSENFRNMFSRMRDMISPSGSIPEYGDGYFEHRQVRLDFALLLEMAARLYDDASFHDAARRFLSATPGQRDEDQLNRAMMLMELEPFVPKKRSSPALSIVSQRRVPGSPAATIPDKLILRTGAQPGCAMIMMDLYAEGSHAHPYKRPSVGYYEAGGVPLFHNIGRRGTQSGQCGNSFWIFDRPDSFPGYPQEKVWNTMTVPANYCSPGMNKGEYRTGDSILLRNFPTPGIKYLRLDNLRLEGPRGSLLLDGFESAKSWHGNVAKHPGVKLEPSGEHTQGAFSQQVNWNIFGEQFCTRMFEEKKARGAAFRLADYDTIKLDYQYEGQHPHCNLRNLFAEWIDLGDRPLHCEVARAQVKQLGEDALGTVEFASYNGSDNTLRRQIVLTREGALMIIDAFTAGPCCGGWAGGQLWQLYTLQESGDDWFASASDGAYALPDGSTADRRMLVKYMKTPGLVTAAERVRPSTMHAPKADGSNYREFFTTYSRQSLSPGKTVVAAMVVLPLVPGDAPEEKAAGIAFEPRAGQGLRVSIPTAAGRQPVIVDIKGMEAEIKRADE